MSHRRRIRIVIGSPTALTEIVEEGIISIEVVDPENEEDAETVTMQESELTAGQIACVNNLGVEFAD